MFLVVVTPCKAVVLCAKINEILLKNITCFTSDKICIPYRNRSFAPAGLQLY